MAKKPTTESDGLILVCTRIELSAVKKLDKLAEDSRRSRSQMLAVLLDEVLSQPIAAK